MLPRKYRSRVVSIINPFEDIYTLEFESLSGKYKYKPGQFLHLAMDSDYDGSGQWPESRCFSMQSNPHDETIRITYSVKGRFTRNMIDLIKVGTELWLKLPYGDLFTQEHCKINTVFIAGGTGITPFLSAFTDPSFLKYNFPRLYIGFRMKDFNIYEKYFEEIRIVNPTIIIKVQYQDVEGILDIESIFKESKLSDTYFISGPQIMISTFRQYLLQQGILKNNIFSDDWA